MKIVECPRDAMQGLSTFIPTEKKIDYINSLIKVGYDIIDFGSFVSSKSVPQMRDTVEVIQGLELQDSTSLLSIVLNKRGAVEASSFEQIDIIGYPLSISEVFQQKNSKKTIESSLLLIDDNLTSFSKIPKIFKAFKEDSGIIGYNKKLIFLTISKVV